MSQMRYPVYAYISASGVHSMLLVYLYIIEYTINCWYKAELYLSANIFRIALQYLAVTVFSTSSFANHLKSCKPNLFCSKFA